ncbi:ATP-dependent helicase [Streptomyces tateyamensis]|uniref:ATP-dependent helicase n=2 Tax=Streptomyces tateyamensis TaxID=565073 RepID=A0A2V4P2I6_9ACTN|nr:ATP-dependent helicase [Streptomyces tateyamensis]PYC76962.1 ATP-dependent helicase [Streptomyces tateyamensis]
MADPQLPTDPMAGFAPATRAWFEAAFDGPTSAQAGAWAAIREQNDVLVVAPTGSGKTLAAFLSALDRLATTPPPAEPRKRLRVLYVSPLKALAVDVERNLRAPLTGLRQAAVRLGLPEPEVQVGIRSGDTPAAERRKFQSHPPDILITTPESLFLLLTSASREALRGVDTVILDEVHAVAGTKRGAHLALSLERLDELLERPARRIGLSATVRPVEEVARYLSPQRGAAVVQPPAAKEFDLSVVVPVADLGELSATPNPEDPARSASIWPHVEERIVDLVQAHRSTIVFANSRRLAERLCNRLNEIAHERATGAPLPEAHGPAELMGGSGAAGGAPPVLARAHHGSVSKEQRALVEEELKAGRLPAVVATSSLELGIDMGAVDLVVQVESPPSVASGLQRVGRAGHQVGAVSTGVVFPKYRGDLVQSAVVTERMRAGRIEALRVPRNPLDVLAQQLVAICALDSWDVTELLALVRRAAPFASLPQSAFDSVLDMLAGRYPSDAFAELRPRLVWDRVAGTVTGRPGAQRLAVTSGGTIPDRGLFGVFIAGSAAADEKAAKKGGGRVGELDEEMVYESRVGDVFTLGTSSWRIQEITHDKVLVTPAPGVPGRLPFWKGDSLGRPLELGRALGAFVRELGALPEPEARERLTGAGLDTWAADNLLGYLAEQRQAAGHLPDDRTIVVERFRDELGDWRIVIHSPFGAQVHAPWALALGARLRERHGLDPQVMHGDDGIVLRLPDADLLDFPSADAPSADEAPVGADAALFDPGEVEQLVTDQVGGSALFASRFRECAGRALLLPRRSPGKRTPLWQQRQRAAQLLEVAGEYGSFPIVLEAVRECLQDVFDLPGLVELMRDLESRAVRLVEVTTPEPSPFARSLLFGYVAQYLYEGDSPLAERRAAALALDSRLLAELLGQAELRELIDPAVLAELEAELQRLTPERRIKDVEGVADALRLLGPLSTAELAERGAEADWAAELQAARRAIAVRIAGEQRWAAIEDAGRLSDALGTPLPVGVPEAFTEPVKDPLGDLLARFARTNGPFTAQRAGARFGLGTAVVTGTLQRLTAAGRLVHGEFRPVEAGGTGEPEWCDAEVLRRLRRRSLAALRQEVEAVPPRALGAFLPQWQHLNGHQLRGEDGLFRIVEQLQGAVLPASALERLVLPARLSDYQPELLDRLMAQGEIGWAGAGALPGKDGWISLHLGEAVDLVRPDPLPLTRTPLHETLLAALASGYGLLFKDLCAQAPDTPEPEVVAALWDLVWAGLVTNDTLAPIRALLGSGRTPGATAHRAPRSVPRGRYGGLGRVPARPADPTVGGRWSRLPAPAEPTARAAAQAQVLLDRHGVLTRGTVQAERVAGGFAGVYRVLSAFEERGRARRGYLVEGLGGAQFAMDGAADRLRSINSRLERSAGADWPEHATAAAARPQAQLLAAADPANAYGAALPWPEPPGGEQGGAHRPGRKAGALVVLVDGELVLYLERGGKSLLCWSEDEQRLAAAVPELVTAVRRGRLTGLTVEKANGEQALGSALGAVLEGAGFHATPRGLRLRG